MSDETRSEAILFWGFISPETLAPHHAFGWKENVWQYELARRLGIEPPEKIVSQRRNDEWQQWRQLVHDAMEDWACTFSWYGTESDKRWFVALTESMHIADGSSWCSIDNAMPIPQEAWRIKLDAFCHLLRIPRDPNIKLGWKLVARDKGFVQLPDVQD